MRGGVVRHQRIDHRGRGNCGDGDLVDTIEERAPVDLTVDIQVVRLDRLGGNLRFCCLHGECSVSCLVVGRSDAADNSTDGPELTMDD